MQELMSTKGMKEDTCYHILYKYCTFGVHSEIGIKLRSFDITQNSTKFIILPYEHFL